MGSSDTVPTMVRLWPILTSLAIVISMLAVALYRISQNSKNHDKLEERVEASESLCRQVENIEKDMKRMEAQQIKDFDNNMTFKAHMEICKNAKSDMREMIREELKEFKKELLSELKLRGN